MRGMIFALDVALVCLVGLEGIYGLTCLRCEEQKCPDVRSLDCKGGTTLDACGCCTVCAKVEGEKCGGPWNIGGVCDKGLVCSPKSNIETGRCVNPNGGGKRLPRCKAVRKYSSFRKSGYRRCLRRRTVFCNKCCERCCEHSTTCNPDVYNYIPRNRCRRQERLHVPRRLQLGDEENDENEVDLPEEDIKM
ncbi:cysteine-rich motor neuron 1 protein-like [Rhopilema esculentum]|uniref:cysteine-rich motor neuron 1 protein-like n=1 Tax=Rhopilema esculentum TaxID=499914 RepID=UPI0031D0977A